MKGQKYQLSLLIILIAALTFRVSGIGFGLPLTIAHPDESRVNLEGIGVLTGKFRPSFFNYPSLFTYTLGAADAAYCGASVLAREHTSLAACAASWRTAWEPFFLVARLVSALAGTLTVWLAYELARRLFDAFTGIIAAAFLAVAFLHVRDSHFGVTDVAMTMLVVAAVVLLARAVGLPSLRSFATAGLVAGLATSTKYNGALLAVVALTALAMSWRTGRPARRVLGDGIAFGAAMIGAFLLGTPYAVVDPARFWADASSEAAHLQLGHGMNLGIGWQYHAAVTLWYGLTWPLFLAGVGGAAIMIVRSPRASGLLLAFPIVYYVVAGSGYTVFARYMIPIIPFLCVAAAYFTMVVARAVARSHDDRAVHAIAVVMAAALAIAPAAKSWRLDRLLARTDSRVLAADWISANIPENSSLLVTGAYYGRPDVGRRQQPPFYVLTERGPDGFRTESGSPTGPPDVIVIQESPLTNASIVPQEIRDAVQHYRRVQTFRAIDMDASHVFDQQDALFVPLAGFEGVGRPGPNLSIFQRVD